MYTMELVAMRATLTKEIVYAKKMTYVQSKHGPISFFGSGEVCAIKKWCVAYGDGDVPCMAVKLRSGEYNLTRPHQLAFSIKTFSAQPWIDCTKIGASSAIKAEYYFPSKQDTFSSWPSTEARLIAVQ